MSNAPTTGVRRVYPALIIVSALLLAALVALDVWLISRRDRYRQEIARLRASMTELERQHTDRIVAQEENKVRLALALLRRQAQLENALHLSITIDSGAMALEREGALLRQMPVQIGPERRIGIAPDTVRLAPPRGVRTVVRVLTGVDAWEVPSWVYADRGLTLPEERSVPGALGDAAILLDGGTVIYAFPPTGPLSDSAYVLAGAIRARAEDLVAIVPNVTPGMRVYFY